MKHLGIISAGYPSPGSPTSYTFVRQFAHAVVRSGIKCTVFSPVSLHDYLSNREGYPYFSTEKVDDFGSLDVYRPRFISFGARAAYAKLGVLNPSFFTLRSYTNTILRVIQREGIRLDSVYGHFLYLGGAAAIRVGQHLGQPAFSGLGENTDGVNLLWSIEPFGVKHAKKIVEGATKIIANSKLLTNSILRELSYPPEKMKVFPNGTDLNSFKPSSKGDSRRRFGLPCDAFIVGTVGHFSDRKGQERVIEAIKSSESIKVVFAGQNIPYELSEQVLWNSPVNQDQMPEFLSACDVFVLPTLREGCCNAIIEAMACGLPIISSDRAFNDDLLSEDISIRVDPLSVDAIRDAIIALRDDPRRRERMAQGALEKSKLFDVSDRVKRILKFMEIV